MKRLLLSFICILVTTAFPVMAGKKKVHTIGDSTMANYATDGSTDKRGWTQMLQQFFNTDNITVNNRGKSGASSKSFYKESAYWPTLKSGGSDAMQPGDYLLIQFAHNDEKTQGTDGDELKAYYTAKGDASAAAAVDYRGTTAFDTYKKYIRSYINEAKAMGVTPIVVGPICRKYFTSGDKDISRTGRHDLGDNFSLLKNGQLLTGQKVAESDDTYDYVASAKAVAEEYDDVPFIDLTTLTANLYLKYGSAYCTANLFCSGDNTHPAALGATLIAREFAQQLKIQAQSETDAKKKAVLEGLAKDVIVSNEITFNPTSGDFGEAYIGMNVTKEYNISAFGMVNESGKFTISATDGFLVSTDKNTWTSSLEVDYSSYSLISTIYVRASITKGGTVEGTLTASDGTNSKTLPLSVSGISMTGGEETTCTWHLNSTSTAGDSPILTALDETASELEIMGTMTPEGHSPMQHLGIKGGTWPAGEIDEVSTRYVQFQMTVPSDKVFNLDRISFDVCGWGGNTVSYHAYYATKADFSDQVLISEGLSLKAKEPVSVTKDVVKKLEEGESVYIRIYPWLNALSSTATGKYIALSEVTLHGTVSDAGAETIIISDAAITFPFLDSEDKMGDAVYGSIETEACLATPEVKLGTSLKISGTRSLGDVKTALKVQNISGSGLGTSPSDAQSVIFTIRPADGFTFIPSNIEFGASRIGTSGGNVGITIEGKDGAKEIGTFTALGSYKPADEKTFWGYYTSDIDGVVGNADQPIRVKLSILGLGSKKEIALNNIKVTGTLSGSHTTTTKYSLQYTVSPADAGTVTVEPRLDAYKEGSEVTITAKKNFGYRFVKWMEGDTQISAKATKTITTNKDRNITAVFEPVPVYTIKTSAVNDMEKPLGCITISPDEHQGRYEEGETVTVTANETKIMKFAGWKDEYMNHSVTTATRNIIVSQDMEIIGEYEIQDFIAVFDASSVNAYASASNYPFNADVTWDEQRNAQSAVVRLSDGTPLLGQGSTPVVRNRTGVVLSNINGLYQNGYRTSDIAWQYRFSTKDFTNIKFVADMAAKNAASVNYKAQYSLDGSNYTDIAGASWSVTANIVKPLEISLPAEAEEKDLVYLRIMGTGSEVFNSGYAFDKTYEGVPYCDHSESGVGNVYVLGEAKVQDDGKAPYISSTSPVNGAESVSSSGTITISYSERIQRSSLNAEMTMSCDGKVIKTIEPIFSSRSLSFPYANLTYGASYTVNIPAGYVEDRNGNPAEAYTLVFTVMDRQKPASRTFDAIVDGSLKHLAQKDGCIPATEDMPVQYRTIQAAIDAAPADGKKPYLIYIKNGEYRDPNFSFNAGYGTRYTSSQTGTGAPTERIAGGINEYDSCRIVYINKPNIHLIGQSRDNVIISTDRLDGSTNDAKRVWYHISAGATVEVQAGGTDCHIENLTVDNESWTKHKMQGPQALCFNVSGDRAILNNVRTRSYQDTYYNGSTRTFINESEIHGAVDFIYGNGDVWFEKCVLNINRPSGGFIVAPSHPENTAWGYVFNNTRITTDEVSDPSRYSIWLGRPWHEKPKTVFLHTTMELTPMDSLWYETMGGLPAIWAVHDFHNANGYAFSGAKNASRKAYYYTENGKKIYGYSKNFLTDEEVASYTIANVFAGDGTTKPSGYWNPSPVIEKTAVPSVSVNGNIASWQKDEYAICYVVTVNGKAVAFPTDNRYVGNEGDVVTVQSVNEYGSLSNHSASVTLASSTDIQGTEAGKSQLPASNAEYDITGKRISHAARGIVIDGKTGSKTFRK